MPSRPLEIEARSEDLLRGPEGAGLPFRPMAIVFRFARQGQAACAAPLAPLTRSGGQTFQKVKQPQAMESPSGHHSGIPIRPSQARKI